MITWILSLTFILSSSYAVAEDFDVMLEASVRKTLQISQRIDYELVRKAEKKVEGCHNQCLVYECDVLPQTECRAGRVLFFRGEKKMYSMPAVSGLARNYQEKHLGEWMVFKIEDALDYFKNLIRPLRPFGIGDVTNLTLSKSSADFDGGRVRSSEKSWTSLKFVYALHKDAWDLQFTTATKTNHNVDPLVSFSALPKIASAFLHPYGGGRMVVLSVPEKQIKRSCNFEVIKPGDIWDPINCKLDSIYDFEREWDAVLFVNPEYIFRSYEVF